MDGVQSSPIASDQLVVRPVRRDELKRWKALMRAHHYLGFDRIIGESLCYVGTRGTEWVGLLGWGSAALKCAARDSWIGWDRQLQWRRLRFIANNVRFLILPGYHQPNLASRLLALNVKRLSRDWQLYHGHPILIAETFVDPSRFRGTCYRAAGWQALGHTRGYSKCNSRYWLNAQPKLLLVRPLLPDARARLLAPLPPALSTSQKEDLWMIDLNRLPLQGEGSLMELLGVLVDPRKPRGVRHPVATVVAIAICAALSGARSFCAIAEWAQGLTREALKQLGSNRPKPPSEPTIRRLLQRIDAASLDAHVSHWLLQHYPLVGRGVAVDGKTLRGAHDSLKRAPHLLSAILHQEAVVLGQTAVEEKTNEIPKLPHLLDPLPLQGATVTADAMHTQQETARYLVEDKQADYLFTVKDNQSTLRKDIADLNLTAFPPGAHYRR